MHCSFEITSEDIDIDRYKNGYRQHAVDMCMVMPSTLFSPHASLCELYQVGLTLPT